MDGVPTFRLIFRILPDGERYPFLVGENGIPLIYPTLFATQIYRNGSRAPKTTRAALATIRQIYHWAASNKLDIESQFGRRKFLTAGQIEHLANFLGTPATKASADRAGIGRLATSSPSKVVAIARKKPSRALTPADRYARLSYAAKFLDWLAIRRVEEEGHAIDVPTREMIRAMVSWLEARRPPRARSRRRGQRASTV